MDEMWSELFLKAMRRDNVNKESEFLALVDQVDGHCTVEVARILMKSFLDAPDFGTQERVVSVLASADKSIAVTAILEELPRLLVEAPEWAKILIGQEVDRRPKLLVELAKCLSDDVQQSIRHLLSDGDFRDFYPNAKTLVI